MENTKVPSGSKTTLSPSVDESRSNVQLIHKKVNKFLKKTKMKTKTK